MNGVIFDADGTLLDSMWYWDKIVIDLINTFGNRPPQDSIVDELVPMSAHDGAQYLRKQYGIELSADEIISWQSERVYEFYKHRVKLRPGIYECVKELSRRGIPMIVASATDRYMIEAALKHTDIFGDMSDILSCSDIGKGKDKPDIFLTACGIINTSPENTIVVEDSPTALETARCAGFMTVRVTDDDQDLLSEILLLPQKVMAGS